MTPTLVAAAIGGAVLLAKSPADAPYRVGPVYPENPANNQVRGPAVPRSGYDPFILDPRTGRFNYVPMPYEPEPPGANYNPYRFNWHSGRWDYVPQLSPQDNVATDAGDEASTARYEIPPISGAGGGGPGAAPVERRTPAPQRSSQVVPSGVQPVEPAAAPAPEKPTTQPTTAPARLTGDPGRPPAMRVKLAGHWEYDYQQQRWIFILPPG